VEVSVWLVSRSSVQLPQHLPPHKLRAARRTDETANLRSVPSLLPLAQKPAWGETQETFGKSTQLRIQCFPKHPSSYKAHNCIHNSKATSNINSVSINHFNFSNTCQIICNSPTYILSFVIANSKWHSDNIAYSSLRYKTDTSNQHSIGWSSKAECGEEKTTDGNSETPPTTGLLFKSITREGS